MRRIVTVMLLMLAIGYANPRAAAAGPESMANGCLTGLYNYRFFREHLAREISRCQRNGTPLSLLMIDIDDFKLHNDRFGHDESNSALTHTGRLLTESLRREDVAVRFGGEEFAVMLPAIPKTGAAVVAEKTRQGIQLGLATEADQPGNLTVSIGIATFPADAVNTGELIEAHFRAPVAA